MISIIQKEYDDVAFTRIVTRILNNSISFISPNDVYLVQVDRRFDYKWMGFSNKFLGAVGVWHLTDLRIPPFVPEKIVEEKHFQTANGRFVKKYEDLLHIHQASEDNKYRKIKEVSNSAIFLWYSGGTRTNTQGSLMLYSIKEGIQSCWFASFVNNGTWQVRGTQQISVGEVHSLIEMDFYRAEFIGTK